MRNLKQICPRFVFALLLILVAVGLAATPAAAAQQSQDWALRACKNEVGARIADLPLSEIAVESATADGEGNAVINWRTTRSSTGFCRVSRQGNIIQFKVEEMARPGSADSPTDTVESSHINACRTEAARRLGLSESEVFVRAGQREGDQFELDWRVRRRAAGYCRVDARSRITAFEIYRQNEGGTGTGGSGTGTVGGTGTGNTGDSLPYAQRAAYDSGYSWGDDDRRSNRSRSVQRYSDLYTNDTQAMFGKGYDDGFDRRTKDYTLPGSGTGTGTGTGSGTGTGGNAPIVVKPGRYAIEFAKSGKVLDLRTEDGTTVQQWSGSFMMNKKNQLWDLEDARNGYFYIRSAENGKALTARGQANGSAVEATALGNRREQQWRIKFLESGEAVIVSRLGPALDLPGGNNDNGVKPHLWQEHGRDNQRFRLKPTS